MNQAYYRGIKGHFRLLLVANRAKRYIRHDQNLSATDIAETITRILIVGYNNLNTHFSQIQANARREDVIGDQPVNYTERGYLSD